MLSRLHNKLGTAGLTVAIVALVLAVGGTALAASALTGKQKKEVEKIAKKFAGKPGPTGPQGSAGPAGQKGDTGAEGKAGPQGNPGAPGKSVVLTTEAKGANCAEGGTKVEVEGNAASKKYVCNGIDGTSGFTETLPPGETETGTWHILATTLAFRFPGALESISFPIPLAGEGVKGFVFNTAETENEEFGTSGCSGTVDEPTAPPGALCVYTSSEEKENVTGKQLFTRSPTGEKNGEVGVTGAYLTGLTLAGEPGVPAELEARGTWAVTAPTP